MIALWGVSDDTPLIAVRDALVSLGSDMVFIDQRRFLASSVDLVVGRMLGHVEGVVRLDHESISLAHLTAAYLRPVSLEVATQLHGQRLDPAVLERVGRM